MPFDDYQNFGHGTDHNSFCRVGYCLNRPKKFLQNTWTLVDVPQQTGCDDCGIYVCRSMEFPDDVMTYVCYIHAYVT